MKYCKQCSIWQDKELSLKTSVHKLLDADNAAGRLRWFERPTEKDRRGDKEVVRG